MCRFKTRNPRSCRSLIGEHYVAKSSKSEKEGLKIIIGRLPKSFSIGLLVLVQYNPMSCRSLIGEHYVAKSKSFRKSQKKGLNIIMGQLPKSFSIGLLVRVKQGA
mgnify:CR=1 FL=1